MNLDQFVQLWKEFDSETFIIANGQKPHQNTFHHMQISRENQQGQLGYTATKDKVIELVENKLLKNTITYLPEPFNILSHLTHLEARSYLDQFKEQLNQIKTPGEDPDQLTNENRALEWLRLTMQNLKGSIEQANRQDNAFIQCLFFIQPSQNKLNLKVFNLEFNFFIHQEQLWLEVFDYKANRENKELKLKQNFVILHKHAFDEVLKVIIQINKCLLN